MAEPDRSLIEEITEKILRAASIAESEMKLQIEVEHILRNFFDMMKIIYQPSHNLTIINGKPDTLYGRVIIEYKIPGTLSSKAKSNAAVVEAQKNIKESSIANNDDISKYVGIVLDGNKITFTKFRGKWVTEQVADVSVETISRMLSYLRGLSKKPLNPDSMVLDFGPKSRVAKSAVQVLYRLLKESNAERVKVLYEEWKITFNQVCGYDFVSAKLDIQELIDAYELGNAGIQIHTKSTDLARLLFAIHTYYALVIKFLAAEIVVTYAAPLSKSYLEQLVNINSAKLRLKLAYLEEGGIFSELNIKNFLEGDFFGWYLDTWNDELKDVISLIMNTLLEYEPSTAALEPDEVRDLLKKLYQYLLPRKVRHDLGEFFTPDWLAEIVVPHGSSYLRGIAG